MSLHDDLLTAAAYLEGDGVSMEAAEADRIAAVFRSYATALAVEAPSDAAASASGAVGETAAGVKCAAQPHPMRPARLLSKNEVQHCTLGLGSLAAAAAVQRQFAAINGIQIAPAAGVPATSNDLQEKQR